MDMKLLAEEVFVYIEAKNTMIIGLDRTRCLDFVSNNILSECDTCSVLILYHKM